MSDKKTNEERQKEVDRQLELMKAAIGDDNFSDSDSDSEDSEQLKERTTKRDAMESARKFLWDEAEDDDEVLLGGPFPKTAPPAVAMGNQDTASRAGGSAAGGDRGSGGLFSASIFGASRGEDDFSQQNINLMDASEAHASQRPATRTSRSARPSLSNLFLRGSPETAAAWNDAGARDSEEFIQEKRNRTNWVALLAWVLVWIVALGLFGVFIYYIYDVIMYIRSTPKAEPIQVPTTPMFTEDHAELIKKALIASGVLSESFGSNTPQAAALKWITEDTTATGMDEKDPYFVQRYSLAVLFHSTRGQHWENNNNWLSTEGYCEWHGIQCLGKDTIIEQNNHNGPVFEVSLSSNKMKGTIPVELNFFDELFFLDLQDNELEGTIPNDLGGWTALRMFSVAHNQLYGSLPSNLFSTSPDLHALNAGHNKFTGTLPPEIGSAAALREIRLEYNGFHGTIPSTVKDLDRVETLHLAGNTLHGSLPPAIFDMDRLETLHLDNNKLSGGLSTDFSRLSHLEMLTLNHNKFVGSVPDVFSKNRQLQELHLHGNELTGNMPHTVCSLRSNNKLSYLSVDCSQTDDSNAIGVHCECCTECK